jgi:hypothetical protein
MRSISSSGGLPTIGITVAAGTPLLSGCLGNRDAEVARLRLRVDVRVSNCILSAAFSLRSESISFLSNWFSAVNRVGMSATLLTARAVVVVGGGADPKPAAGGDLDFCTASLGTMGAFLAATRSMLLCRTSLTVLMLCVTLPSDVRTYARSSPVSASSGGLVLDPTARSRDEVDRDVPREFSCRWLGDFCKPNHAYMNQNQCAHTHTHTHTHTAHIQFGLFQLQHHHATQQTSTSISPHLLLSLKIHCNWSNRSYLGCRCKDLVQIRFVSQTERPLLARLVQHRIDRRQGAALGLNGDCCRS